MKIIYWIYNLTALLFIYLIPDISKALSFPLYLFEPMRLFIIISIIHTSKRNSYLLAVLLPVFSYLLASHPSLIKTGLLLTDLLLNIFLFFYLKRFINNVFLIMCIAILASKAIYYLLKIIFIEFSLLSGDIIATKLEYQLAIVLVLSGYVFFIEFLKRHKQLENQTI